MDQQQLPTIEDLLAWAGEKNQQQPIGKVAKMHECPLAHYLNEHEEKETRFWRVGSERIMDNDDGSILIPDHLYHVIKGVDHCPGCENGYIYPPAFIHILQTVQQRMKEGGE